MALQTPPIQVKKAAKTAAASPHALINLIRLVKALERAAGDDDLEEADGRSDQVAQRTQSNLQYARVLLETLREGNEGSSNTASTLKDLEHTLNTVEAHYAPALDPTDQKHALPNEIATTPSQSITRPASRGGQHGAALLNRSAAPEIRSRPASPPAAPHEVSQTNGSPKLRHRKTPSLSTYLSSRQAEDRQGGDIGLLPLKPRTAASNGPSSRDQLFGGTTGVGMGAAQLHEELGGQLADMSHRLKLNAVHFSKSLEEEKALLETSQDTLENNLTATRSSKKHLSSVSKKGRGTTCMTLGIVILVLVIFIWTYMLIRFT